jgi:tRNA(fMet)-specific endonuclease VapC
VNLKYLLDTNIFSEVIRPRPNAVLMGKVRRYWEVLAMAAPVWHQMLYGYTRLARRDPKRLNFETYFFRVVKPSVPVLPYDEAAAQWHASERVRLERLGKPRPYADGQIAAVAKVNELILVTANVQDFLPFQGLQIEDWTASGPPPEP